MFHCSIYKHYFVLGELLYPLSLRFLDVLSFTVPSTNIILCWMNFFLRWVQGFGIFFNFAAQFTIINSFFFHCPICDHCFVLDELHSPFSSRFLKFFSCALLITRLLPLVGRLIARRPVWPHQWVAVVTPTDHPKSVRNRCVIEGYGGVICVVMLLFGFFCGCMGFCHRTESDIFLFLLLSHLRSKLRAGWTSFSIELNISGRFSFTVPSTILVLSWVNCFIPWVQGFWRLTVSPLHLTIMFLCWVNRCQVELIELLKDNRTNPNPNHIH